MSSKELKTAITAMQKQKNELETKLFESLRLLNGSIKEEVGLTIIANTMTDDNKFLGTITENKWATKTVAHDIQTFSARLKDIVPKLRSKTLKPEHSEFPRPLEIKISVNGVDWSVHQKLDPENVKDNIFVFKSVKAPKSIVFEMSGNQIVSSDNALINSFEKPRSTIEQQLTATRAQASISGAKVEALENQISEISFSHKKLISAFKQIDLKQPKSRATKSSNQAPEIKYRGPGY